MSGVTRARKEITRLAMTPGLGKQFYDEHIWSTGLRGQLPNHYKEFYKTWSIGPDRGIHYEPKAGIFEKDKFGVVQRIQNVDIPVIYPEEFHAGLWGGEGVIKGLNEPEKQRHYPNPRIPQCNYWWPKLHLAVVYSRVLDKYIEMPVTRRGLKLVDKAHGFDNYLLRTPVNEIYAWTLLKIKREILLKLCYPEENQLKSDVMKDFESYRVDFDIADWHGLRLEEAFHKAKRANKVKALRESRIPLKQIYREELVNALNQGYLENIDTELIIKEEAEAEGQGIMNSFSKKVTGLFKK
ncbi:large ribosomal subunit protein bL28m [Lepeophtheirus salmonis]|uniref:Large ribosomal subunit protein bL28m n=1 Tax=Lepeophtheirus salmonis TaxID=72036 RepID=D3PFM3_LEPSM|nr:39S ribosomal protein L28, mitochondrial-like [Lepeophtheirus salmonis]ADD24069.1 39S ribosomal protein L28, mitochondrial [Lepeophtheirus salmonis]